MSNGKQFVCSYGYDDEDGFHIGEHVRWRLSNGDKTFSYRHGAPGRYEYAKPKGMDDLLYRLPELLAHKKAWHGPQPADVDDWHRGIWWAEGEKDADALRAAGVFATSHHGGATKVTPAQCEWFRGYDGFVTLVADNDGGPGAADALARLSGLYAVGLPGRRIRIVQAAAGKDAHDHLVAGHSLSEFQEVDAGALHIRAAAFQPSTGESGYDWSGLQEWRTNIRVEGGVNDVPTTGPQPVDWAEFWSIEPEPVRYLVAPFVAAGEVTRIYAQAKVGKSLLGQEMAAALATGAKVLGEEVEQQTVLYIDQENTDDDWRSRLADMGYNGDSDLSRLLWFSLQSWPPLDSAPGGRALIAKVQEHAPALVILDTQSKLLDGDEDKAPTSAAFYRHSLLPLKRLGVAVLILDHAGNDPSKPRGSSGKRDDVDVVWQLSRSGAGLRAERTHFRKRHEVTSVALVREEAPLRHVIEPTVLRVRRNTNRCLAAILALDPPPKASDSARSVAQRLREANPKGFRDVVVREALRELREDTE